jgi:hypothetical protein
VRLRGLELVGELALAVDPDLQPRDTDYRVDGYLQDDLIELLAQGGDVHPFLGAGDGHGGDRLLNLGERQRRQQPEGSRRPRH